MLQKKAKPFVLTLLPLVLQAYENPCGVNYVPFPTNDPTTWTCIDQEVANANSMQYLAENLPSFDEINKCSLGFCPDTDSGIASFATDFALGVKGRYSWAASVPEDIYLEYVVPYANVNEGRNNIRPLLNDACTAIFEDVAQQDLDKMTISDAALLINSKLWSGNPVLGKTIVFKSSQTPLIYDPMSTLAFGYASCTGVSIFFVDALRSVGIPARIAGTPAWN